MLSGVVKAFLTVNMWVLGSMAFANPLKQAILFTQILSFRQRSPVCTIFQRPATASTVGLRSQLNAAFSININGTVQTAVSRPLVNACHNVGMYSWQRELSASPVS